MRILQISIEVNSGSVGRIAEQIGQAVLKNGGQSYITFARNNLPSKSTVIKIGNKFDLYAHALQTRLIDNHCFASTNATKKLVEEIIRINPDIIHLHHLHGYFINIEILFKYLKEAKKPVVWTFHDCWSFTGHCAHFDFVQCEKWKTECNGCPQLNEYPKTLFLDRSKSNYIKKMRIFNGVENLTIVPVSHWLERLVKESFLNNYPAKVIQNGIDTEIFSPQSNYSEIRAKFGISKPFLILGVASTWDKKKGLDFFIGLDKLISPDSIIVLVGLTKKQIKNLPKTILGIERTENVLDLAGLYSAADVFVNPTLEDTFPTTNLESLSCGTPVITFETGGSVESVNVDTGLVVKKGDVDGLYKAIQVVKTYTKSHYSTRCRKRALELYDRELKFQEYIDLYEEIVKNGMKYQTIFNEIKREIH